jgi:hypothetical protein
VVDIKSSGHVANTTGNALESYVLNHLVAHGYKQVQSDAFVRSIGSQDRMFVKHFKAGVSIYNTPIFSDFVIYHPQKWPYGLIIEVKWQEVKGSVDEKYPYLVLNINTRFPYKAIVLLDGGGYKPGAEAWLRRQVGIGNLLGVFNMVQLQTWANRDQI